MNPFISDLMLRQTQRCQHLAWFLYGCVEREHRLNLDACVTWWVQAFVPAATLRVGREHGPSTPMESLVDGTRIE
jgi:hypothetical protein